MPFCTWPSIHNPGVLGPGNYTLFLFLELGSAGVWCRPLLVIHGEAGPAFLWNGSSGSRDDDWSKALIIVEVSLALSESLRL